MFQVLCWKVPKNERQKIPFYQTIYLMISNGCISKRALNEIRLDYRMPKVTQTHPNNAKKGCNSIFKLLDVEDKMNNKTNCH